MADIDTQILPLAQRQHGLFTVGQVVAGGATHRMVRYRVQPGQWARRSSTVLALAGAPVTYAQTVMAMCLHTDGTIGSHRCAAWFHRVPQLGAQVVEGTVRYGGTTRNPFGRLHRSVDLRGHDVQMVGLLPITSLPRTVADLFTVLRQQRAIWIAEGLLGGGRLTLDELDDVHAHYARQGRPATVSVRALLERLDEDPPLQSELECRTRELLVAAGVREPTRQVPLAGWVEHPAHVDFAYVDARLILEVDGRSWHSRTTEFELDRRRDNAAQLAGWVVLRFTWRQVTQDPDYVIATVRQALRHRTPTPA
jgi:very-short-patch-repair endonuclease